MFKKLLKFAVKSFLKSRGYGPRYGYGPYPYYGHGKYSKYGGYGPFGYYGKPRKKKSKLKRLLDLFD